MKTDKIFKIEVENVKGFGQDIDSAGNKTPYSFDVDIFPNKPNIVVAPNGFGKSSLTAAFLSLSQKKMCLEKEFIHQNGLKSSIAPNPSLSIYVEDGKNSCFKADDHSNSISDNFDVFVINSRLSPNVNKLKIQGKTITSPYLGIEKSVLVQTIPQKVIFQYSTAVFKKQHPAIAKTLKNISHLFKNVKFLEKTLRDDLLDKFGQVKCRNLLNSSLKRIVTYVGTATEIRNQIVENDYDILKSNDKIYLLLEIIREYSPTEWENADIVLTMYQYIDEYQRMGKSEFKKAVAYLSYQTEQAGYQGVLDSINTTRFKLQLKEEKRSLVINWPKASDISNGQRDVLSFTSSLIEAKRKLKAEKCILVVDEVFDYLDDSNLLTFQYQIVDLINSFKKQEKLLYPILFTHVDPEAFNHWSFGKHKMHVSYLKKVPIKKDQNLLLLVSKRNEVSIKAEVEKYFFHYHPESLIKGNVDLSSKFQLLGISHNIGDAFDFYAYVQKECFDYINGLSVNPIAVAFALRIKIEGIVYSLLNASQKITFINEHGTSNKLDYASEFLADRIPESFYLLGLIYNGVLHCKFDCVEQSIALKLENQTIKKMICDVFS